MNILDDLKDKVAPKKNVSIDGYDFTIKKLPLDVVLDLGIINGDENAEIKFNGNQLKTIVISGVESPKLEIADVNNIFEHKLGVGFKLVEEIMSFYSEGLEDIKKN